MRPISAFRCGLILSAILILSTVLTAQQPPAQPDGNVDSATRGAVIDSLVKEFNENYVFPDVAKKVEADLRSRQSAKEYDSITSAQQFAEKLTNDVRGISHDKHFRVRYSTQPLPIRQEREKPTDAERAEEISYVKFMNSAFEQVERMPGNIGYIRFNGFVDPELGADTVTAAMNFVSGTDALIFDLRGNGGGDPAMVRLICSYLFGDKPVHLNDLYWRKGDRTEEYWTMPTVAGKKFLEKDVYVLTSSRTFSGAEEFSYNLKNLKRATLVGETTGGGANPGGVARLNDHFGAFIPTGRAISPITKTNWEGTGVEPDVKVPREQALKTAYLMALNKAVTNAKDERLKQSIKQVIDQTQKELDDLKAKK